MRQYKWILPAAALCLLLAACTGAGEIPPETTMAETTVATTVATEPETVPTTEPTQPPEERFTLTFVGDCTLGSYTYAPVGFLGTVGEDYDYPLRNVIEYFANDEATLINLEGPLTDTGNPMVKEHTFRGPTDYKHILTRGSVEFASLANNHAMDYGQTGYDSTRETLDEVQIPYVERDATRIFTTKNGLTIGVYGAVYYKLDVEDMTSEITAMAEQGCDLIIYAPHWGIEGNYRPNKKQTSVAYAAIDAGADIVWGSHPHVLQPIEEYNGGLIFYSLGNFCFGGNSSPADLDTALLQLEVIRDSEGTVRLGELTIVPASISSVEKVNNYQPTPYAEGSEAYSRVISKLDGSWEGPNLRINRS